MHDWPPLAEASLLARLALSDEDFFELIMGFARSVPSREFSDALYARALAYPWERPGHSFLLTGTEVQPLEELPPAGGEPRYPLLAIGSNGSPATLIGKFADLPPNEQRIAVVTGDLHDFDIGPAGLPTFYGSFAGTIFASPGTVVRASLVLASLEQLTALSLTERSYFLGRLDGVRFQPDPAGAAPVDSVFTFASRWGTHCVDGRPVALAAVGATDRSASAYTQEQLLDRAAGLVLGEGATGKDLVTRLIEDFASTAASIAPVLRELTQPFASDRWTRFPSPPPTSQASRGS